MPSTPDTSLAKPTTPPDQTKARFLTGSPLRHISVNTSYATLGFLAIFSVDLMDIFFLSIFGNSSTIAAVGFAGTLLFLPISVCIGTQISATSNVSRALGAGESARAKSLSINTLLFALSIGIVTTIIMFTITPTALAAMGASDQTLESAISYQIIMTLSTPVLAIGMSMGGILRARGDPKRAMYGAGIAAILNAVLDPPLIYLYGIEGAAYASVAARVAMLLSHTYCVVYIHNGLCKCRIPELVKDIAPISRVAFSAIVASLAAPITLIYMTYRIAPFGDEVMSGWAIIGRIIPVAFCGLFALSGGVGPVVGQNFGGQRYDRVLTSIFSALLLGISYVSVVWVILAIGKSGIVLAFSASAGAAAVIGIFCYWYAASFLSESIVYVAAASYNNTGNAPLSTLFGYLRLAFGVIPAIEIAHIYANSVEGLMFARVVGPIAMDLITLVVAVVLVQRKQRESRPLTANTAAS